VIPFARKRKADRFPDGPPLRDLSGTGAWNAALALFSVDLPRPSRRSRRPYDHYGHGRMIVDLSLSAAPHDAPQVLQSGYRPVVGIVPLVTFWQAASLPPRRRRRKARHWRRQGRRKSRSMVETDRSGISSINASLGEGRDNTGILSEDDGLDAARLS